MGITAESPQIGHIDVDSEALRESGTELGVVLAEFGVDARHEQIPTDAPTHGWRVLRRRAEGAVLGAPVDDRRTSWRIASVSTARSGAGAPRLNLHDRVLPLRPSRAERSRGLALRWPDVTRAERDVGRLAVDVVNIGEGRWQPNGDSFHAIGFLQPADDDGNTADRFLGFVGSQDPAFSLDPGEYARVNVMIDPDQLRSARPGRYHVHAVLTELPLRTDEPLVLELTEELIERHKPQNRAPSSRVDRESAISERLALDRAMLAARDRLHELVEIIIDAPSDQDARRGIRELLDCGPVAAEAIYLSQLRRFRSDHLDVVAREVEELGRELADADADDADAASDAEAEAGADAGADGR